MIASCDTSLQSTERINASGKNKRQIHPFLRFEATGIISQVSPVCLLAFVKSRGRKKTKSQQDDNGT